MENILKLVGALTAIVVLLFVSPFFGIVFGAFSGWAVGLFWPVTLAKLASALGVAGTPAWQLGAGLGFLGGFFKATLTTTKVN